MENKTRKIQLLTTLIKEYLDERFNVLGVEFEINIDSYLISCGILDHVDSKYLSLNVKKWLRSIQFVFEKKVIALLNIFESAHLMQKKDVVKLQVLGCYRSKNPLIWYNNIIEFKSISIKNSLNRKVIISVFRYNDNKHR